jgi:membrane protease YdiL (CAAX protease family)
MLGLAHLSTATALLSGGLLLMLGFYGWLASRSSARAVLTVQPFGIPDAIFASILGLWMISIISHGFESPQAITLEAVIANSVLYGILVMVIFGLIGFQKHSAVTLFSLQLSRFPKAAATALLWLLITYPLIFATQAVVQQFTGNTDDSQEIVHFFLKHPDFRSRAAVIFMAVIVAPVAEEIIFRGYFYGVIRRYGGCIPALLTSSLLFAAIHDHLPSAPGLFVLATILCLLYERTGSLWANITLHAAFNASTLICLIFWPDLLT